MSNDLAQARALIRNCLKKRETYLDLGNCGITDLNDLPQLFKCTHLTTLVLSDSWWQDTFGENSVETKNPGTENHITSLPENIVELKSLTKLIFSVGKPMQIDHIEILGKLTTLKYLDIRYIELDHATFLSKLIRLETLYLYGNNLRSIDFIDKLKSLRHLDVNSNPLTSVDILSCLQNLETLDIGYTKVSDISALSILKKVYALGLRNIPILEYTLHTELPRFENIREIDLTGLNIRDVNFLIKLPQIRKLFLGHNEIRDASAIRNLNNLEYLSVEHNYITDIAFIENLRYLKYADIGSNKITEISYAVVNNGFDIHVDNMPETGLYLGNNPIQHPPIEIVAQGRDSIIDWYKATKRQLNEIKVVLIGDPKAGKTSLLRRLKDNTFDEKEVQTDGINIEDIHFGNSKSFKDQASLHNLTAHFWDFGGQEIMNSTHQFFLTNRSVYILVLDARKDTSVTEQIRTWVKKIKVSGGNSPILVVANQCDVNSGFGFSNEFELTQEFPEIKCFIKASCASQEGIDEIKNKLEELIPTAELFNTLIDEKWFNIKEQLQDETKSKHFLDETRFDKICRKHKLVSSTGKRNAITFLHDLGLVLHFEDLNLAEYYVLDPYWITYGVYQIVTSAYAGRNNGMVSMDRLEYIVNEEEDKKEIYRPLDYRKITYKSPNQRRFLVDILNQFKLCFYLPGHNYFIIPDLLDTKEPIAETESIRKADKAIRFVYKYDYLPSSVMPYIMVDGYRIIREMWRTGCIMENNNCIAMVSNYQDMISIIVTGEHKGKREFLAVIRNLIDEINRKLSDKPAMMIPLPGINAYADYDVLLNRERKGKKVFIFDEDKPTEKEFEISLLLEGIPRKDEMDEISLKLDEILSGSNHIKSNLEVIIEKQEELSTKINQQYNYLYEISNKIADKDEVISAISQISESQTTAVTNEVMEYIANSFETLDQQIDDKIRSVYEDLINTDDVQVRLGLSVPLINLLGINLGVEWDVKSWTSKMYQKYQLKIFKLMGY